MNAYVTKKVEQLASWRLNEEILDVPIVFVRLKVCPSEQSHTRTSIPLTGPTIN